MSTSRRTILAGLAGLGATTALPAWAQFDNAIRPQSDPWAQVDPYADPRNGFPSAPPLGAADERSFSAASNKTGGKVGANNPPPQPPSEQELAARTLSQALSDPEKYEIINAEQAYYYFLVERPDEGQGPILRNQAAQNAMLSFCAPFFAASDRPHLPWQVFITDTPQLNGFACGGGKIAITSGLIAHADHPAELGAVVAHEIGHNDFRHAAKAGEVAALMTLNKDKTSSFSSEMVQSILGDFQKILVTGFRRENEFEADAHVATLSERLGMDPGRQLVMWDKMIKRYGMDQTKKTCLMDSHPVMQERKQALIARMGGNGNPRAQYVPPGWAELKRHFPTPSGYRWG